MKDLILGFFVLYSFASCAQENFAIPSAQSQIRTTLQAAPESFRDSAKIVGYNSKGELITLRKGSNEMVCLVSDPRKENISATCFGKELEDFMIMGRELDDEGKSTSEKRKARKKEIEQGKLHMPSVATALYVLSVDKENYNFETGEIEKEYVRYALYKPYMTPEETGLSTTPAGDGGPWLMDANTQRSHIMISPLRSNK